MFLFPTGRVCGCLLILLSMFSSGVCAQMAELPRDPIYLWSENPLISPDREGIQNERVYAVDNPSITPFWPDPQKANGAAVVIFPGGGYVRLAIELEGYSIARWLNQQGVAAFVVIYRMQVYGSPARWLVGLGPGRYVRAHAATWGRHTGRVGGMVFSAGPHLAASVPKGYDFRSPQVTDD